MYERTYVLKGSCRWASIRDLYQTAYVDVCLYGTCMTRVSVYFPVPKSCRIEPFELSDVWIVLDSWVGVSLGSSCKSVRVRFLCAAPQGQLFYRGQLGIGCGGLDWGNSWMLHAYCWIVTWHMWGQVTKAWSSLLRASSVTVLPHTPLQPWPACTEMKKAPCKIAAVASSPGWTGAFGRTGRYESKRFLTSPCLWDLLSIIVHVLIRVFESVMYWKKEQFPDRCLKLFRVLFFYFRN